MKYIQVTKVHGNWNIVKIITFPATDLEGKLSKESLSLLIVIAYIHNSFYVKIWYRFFVMVIAWGRWITFKQYFCFEIWSSQTRAEKKRRKITKKCLDLGRRLSFNLSAFFQLFLSLINMIRLQIEIFIFTATIYPVW